MADVPSTSSSTKQQEEVQAHGTQKRKRTRGPRSCVGCRKAKQRCDLPDVTAVLASEAPQPTELACHRCKVLKQACVVSEPLPASYRRRGGPKSASLQLQQQQQQQRQLHHLRDHPASKRARHAKGTGPGLAVAESDEDDEVVVVASMVDEEGDVEDVDAEVEEGVFARREHVFDPDMMEVNWNRRHQRTHPRLTDSISGCRPDSPQDPDAEALLHRSRSGPNFGPQSAAKDVGTAMREPRWQKEEGDQAGFLADAPGSFPVDALVSSRPWIDSVRSSLRPYDSLRMLCYRQATFRRPPPPSAWSQFTPEQASNSEPSPFSRSAPFPTKSVEQILCDYGPLLDVNRMKEALESYRLHIPFVESILAEEIYGGASPNSSKAKRSRNGRHVQDSQPKGGLFLGVLVYLAAKRLGAHRLEAELLAALRQEALATLLRGPSEPGEAAALACLALYEPLLLAKHDEEWDYTGCGKTEGSFDGVGLLAAASTATSNSIDLADTARQLIAGVPTESSICLLRKASLAVSLSSYTTFVSLAGNIQRRPFVECSLDNLQAIQEYCARPVARPFPPSSATQREREDKGVENEEDRGKSDDEGEGEGCEEERDANAEQEERLWMLCSILRYQAVAVMRTFCQEQNAKIERLPPSVLGEEIHNIVVESIDGLQARIDDFSAQLRSLARLIDQVSQEQLDYQQELQQLREQLSGKRGRSSASRGKGTGAESERPSRPSKSRKGVQSPWLIRIDWLEFEFVALHFVCLSRITESTIVLYDSKIGPCNSSKTFLGRLSGHTDLFETLVLLGGHHRTLQAAQVAVRISNLVLPRLANGSFRALTPPPAFVAGVTLTSIQALAEEVAAVSQDSTWNKRAASVAPKAQFSALVMRNMAQALKALDSKAPPSSSSTMFRGHHRHPRNSTSDRTVEQGGEDDGEDEEARAQREKQEEALATSVRRHASILATSAAISQKTGDAIYDWTSASHELRGVKGKQNHPQKQGEVNFPSQLGEQWKGVTQCEPPTASEVRYQTSYQSQWRSYADNATRRSSSNATPQLGPPQQARYGRAPTSGVIAPPFYGTNMENPQMPRHFPPRRRQEGPNHPQQQRDPSSPYAQDASFLIDFVAAQQQSNGQPSGAGPADHTPTNPHETQQQRQTPLSNPPGPVPGDGSQGPQGGHAGAFYRNGAGDDLSQFSGPSLDEFDMLLYEIASVPIDNYFIPGA